MSSQLANQLYLPLISSAEDSRVPMSAVPAKELALLVLAAASGTNTSASFPRFNRHSLWSRMSPAERLNGLMPCEQVWDSSAMQAYRSRLQQLTSELRTSVSVYSSLVPTLTASTYGKNQGGSAGKTGPARCSVQSMARQGTLRPTLMRARGEQTVAIEDGVELCPKFGEWMMGFEENWTALQADSKPSETP